MTVVLDAPTFGRFADIHFSYCYYIKHKTRNDLANGLNMYINETNPSANAASEASGVSPTRLLCNICDISQKRSVDSSI